MVDGGMAVTTPICRIRRSFYLICFFSARAEDGILGSTVGVDTKGERERNEAKHTTHTNRSDLSLCKSPKIYAVQSFTKKCVHKYLRFPDNSASEIAT